MDNKEQLTLIAKHFYKQRSAALPHSDLPEGLSVESLDDALAIQRLLITLNNDKVYGWKCMTPLADGTIIVAPLLKPTDVQTTTCSLKANNDNNKTSVFIEPEIAFILEKDLAKNQTFTDSEVDAAFGDAHMALELIQKRFSATGNATSYDKFADGLFNQGVYLGPKIDKEAAYKAGSFAVTIAQEGNDVLNLSAKHPAELPQNPLYWAMNFLSAQGVELKAGQVFITGSYCGLVELDTQKHTEFNYENLGTMAVTLTLD
ncbi:2-keto-4-pentenoate hydratase [Pseudoalteromonas sp. MMG010]|uniref:2-keto-4-pentenoate hydratase n=1 Tax=Pseudoalteromonas sp. MMG010 TaxID=2822685 RepID=UPI001B3A74CC|nr:2-keto-4-pentenoate hydratase [Pseudoalteromonas sp. MMG010]MBQ4833499.1 2-keto-4-pentenoate hydratase [Pseudoalteromonas sp. MMG010]